MKTIAILQARMGSTRLPGKVMADLAGKPLIVRVIERAQAIHGVDQVILATTAAAADQPLLDVARQAGAGAFAGSEQDVLDRYYGAAQAFKADVIMRLTADCPLLDPAICARVLARFGQGDVDFACNTQPPTFPDGLDTEIFSMPTLAQTWREARLSSEREHVTPYIWKNPAKFRIANVVNDEDLSALRWTVDEPQDLHLVRAIYAALQPTPATGMAAVLAFLAAHPELQAVNFGLERNEGYQKSLQEDTL